LDAEFAQFIKANLSQGAQVAQYAEIAKQIEEEIQLQDEQILGRVVHVSGYVNHVGGGGQSVADSQFLGGNTGRAAATGDSGDMISGDAAVVNAVLSQVSSLSDAIVFSFELQHDVIAFISESLGKHSPFLTGRYMHSHVIFADGVLVEDLTQLPDFTATNEWLFVNTLPYARKIEQGESATAPNGVYEIVAHEAQERYGSTCIIEFIDYTGTYGVMAEATKASYGRRTRQHMNKAENRFPAIRLTFPNK
jgi:hypothetical protein